LRKPIRIRVEYAGATGVGATEVSPGVSAPTPADWSAIEQRAQALIAALEGQGERPIADSDLLSAVKRHAGAQVADFDPEDVEGPGAYEGLLLRIAAAAGGHLAATRVRAEPEAGTGRIALRFEARGKPHEWTFESTPGWVSDGFLAAAAGWIQEETPLELVEIPTPDTWITLVLLPKAVAARLRGLLEAR
jgi:hypothetical protein